MAATPVYTRTAYDIVRQALLVLGVIDRERPITPDLRESGFNMLNDLVKSLQVTYHLWADTEAVLLLESGKSSYSLGPNGDRAVNLSDFRNYNTDSPSSGTNLNVTGTINTNDNIGIFLSDGSVFWTTVASYSAGLAVINNALPETVSASSLVYVYTSLIPRPIKVVNTRIKSTVSGSVLPTSKWNATQLFDSDYETATGLPSAWYYDPQLTNGLYYVNKKPTTNLQVARLTYVRPLNITPDNGDNVDFPSEWFLPLVYLLAEALLAEMPAPDQVTAEIRTQSMKYQQMVGMVPLGKLQPIPEAGA